ncbi:hypothetical protein [Streptomyces sp. NPDC051173]|uniref:hypothetical protein n=1 Tax=Streptomyces sp. NPDC051173 TaxID=3155164 RepID=UPI00344E03D6
MRHRALPGALLALMGLTGQAALSGCQAPQRAGSVVAPSPTYPASVSSDRPELLAEDACAGGGGQSFTEVDCADRRAAARVLARYNGPQASGPRCPDTTDFVLHIAAVDHGDSEEDSSPEGYACMRNLRPPHPGDPGQGGGPLTVTGDCVYAQRDGVVKETACDGSGAHAPEYRVTDEVTTRDACPPSTDLYVQVGGGTPVGCARRLT